MRVGERRHHREIAGIDHHGASVGQVIELVQLRRHCHDLRPAQAH